MANKYTTEAADPKKAKTTTTPFYRHMAFIWPVGIIVALSIISILAFKLSPWPGAMLVRIAFTRNDHKSLTILERYNPASPVTTISNQQYESGNRGALLDVYMPGSVESSPALLPVVIWTHGGAWVSGSKTDDAPYFRLIASHGFIVASVNYTLAPEKTYPTQVFELNNAQSYLIANASRYHINPNKIFLAGDSAGAQLTSQMDAIITNSTYAKEVNIKPSLQPSQLVGTILFCGIYKMQGLTEADPNLPSIIRWGDDQVVWAYSGTQDSSSPIIRQMSPYYHVTRDFPDTFISGGNGDPLTEKQSMPLAKELQTLGVNVTPLFYPTSHQPSLPHEYQFNLDTADAKNALTQLVQFLENHS